MTRWMSNLKFTLEATGHDWKMRRYCLVHGAGASAYVEPKPKAAKRKREEVVDLVEMIEQI